MGARHQSAAERFAELRREFESLQFFCKGTVLERKMKCGQPNCGCHNDPAKRHGPYWEWTYKVQGRTVNVRLRPEAGPLYQAASLEHRRLKSLLRRLETISRAGLAASARQIAAKRKKLPKRDTVPSRT